MKECDLYKNTNMNGIFFSLYIPFPYITQISFLKFQHHILNSIFFYEFKKKDFYRDHMDKTKTNKQKNPKRLIFGCDPDKARTHSSWISAR